MTTEGGQSGNTVKRIFSSALPHHTTLTQVNPAGLSAAAFSSASAVTVTPQPSLQIPISVAANIVASVTKAAAEVTSNSFTASSKLFEPPSVTVSITEAGKASVEAVTASTEAAVVPAVIVTPAVTTVVNNGNNAASKQVENGQKASVEVKPIVEAAADNNGESMAKKAKME